MQQAVFSSAKRLPSARVLGTALLVLGLGVGFSVFSASLLRGQAEERLQLRFLNEAMERYVQVRWRVRSIEQKLTLLGVALAHHPALDETLFRSLAQPLLGEVLAFSWVPVVPHEQREAFELSARQQLGHDFRILDPWVGELAPAPTAEEYFPVLFIATPFLHAPPYGFDLRQHPVRRVALEQARRQGRTAVTGILEVRGLREATAGFLLVEPVFSKEGRTDAAEDGQGELRGFVVAAVGLDALLLEGFRGTGGSMHLTLATSADSAPVFRQGEPGQTRLLPLRQSLPIGDTEWRLELSPGQDFMRVNPESSWLLLLVSGLLVSALVAAGLFLTLGQRQRALALVEERTAQLRDSELRWQYALESARDGVWDWDHASGRVFFSAAWKAMLGYREDEVGDRLEEWRERVHPDDLPACLEALRAHFDGETPFYENEHRMRCRDGSYKWILDRGRVLTRTADGLPLRVIGTHTDIDRQKQAELALERVNAELRKLAITDSLTGIFNRRHFHERLEDEMQRAQRYGSPLSLMMFDLDHFKQVNDRFGHERGDFVLRETCERVAQRLRRSDIFCRSGGEEFVVLCPETDLEQARALAESLLQRLRRDPFAEVGVVTASFGVSAFQPGETADAFLARVDHAMYRAKGEGRDRVVVD